MTDSYKTRFLETKKLLDYGFRNYTVKELLPAGREYMVKVAGGRWKRTRVVNENPLRVLVKRNEENRFDTILKIDRPTPSGAVKAPLAKGAVVGRIAPKYKGNEVPEYLTKKIEMMDGAALVTMGEVKKAGFFFTLFNRLTDFLAAEWSSAFHSIVGKIV